MGLVTSRQEAFESRLWESQALRKLGTTTDLGEIEFICSLLPFVDEKLPIARLTARSDLDTHFALHCGRHSREEQRADISLLTDGFKAKEVWRVLQFPVSSRAPWDWNWQPPLAGDPQKIADLLHTAVSRAVFRVPLCSWVNMR